MARITDAIWRKRLEHLKKQYNHGDIDWETYTQKTDELNSFINKADNASNKRNYDAAIRDEQYAKNKETFNNAKSMAKDAIKKQFTDSGENDEPTNTDTTSSDAATDNNRGNTNNKPQSGNTKLDKWVKPIQDVMLGTALTAQDRSGIDPTGRSTGLRTQAALHDKEATEYQRAAQANNQIANRNYKSEADRLAASQAAAQNAQNVNNLSGAAGTAAAAMQRSVQASDYNTTMQRQDQQRQQGVQNTKSRYYQLQSGVQKRADANKLDYDARDLAATNRANTFLTSGGFGAGDTTTTSTPAVENDSIATEDSGVAPTDTEATTNIDGTDYTIADIMNATNLVHGASTRYINGTAEPTTVDNADYNAAQKEGKATQLANHLREKFNNDLTKIDDYISAIREQMTGKRNLDTQEDRVKIDGATVPAQFTEELGNTMRQ